MDKTFWDYEPFGMTSLSTVYLAINDVASKNNWVDNDGSAYNGWFNWKAEQTRGTEDNYVILANWGNPKGQWLHVKNSYEHVLCHKPPPITTVDSDQAAVQEAADQQQADQQQADQQPADQKLNGN